jgi:hypothetical protein
MKRLPIFLAASALLAATLPAHVSASTAKIITRQVAPGITYKRVFQPKVPRLYHVITLNPSSPYTLDVSPAKPKIPGVDTVANMTRDNKGIVGINGDFQVLPGRPAHLFADDGELFQPAILGGAGRGFGFGADGTPMHIGNTPVQMSMTAPAATAPVARWNSGSPKPGELAVFTTRGGTWEEPPADACAARLLPTGGWHQSGRGQARSFTVDVVRCSSSPLALGEGVVVASKLAGAGADALQGLLPGDTVALSWTLKWKGVTDVLGGSAILVSNGESTTGSNCLSYLCLKHPRTGVGITADGKVLLIVVEGRYWRSKGATPGQFARIFIHEGATYAMNLDGGGSSTMVIEGAIVNYLSDGIQRQVSSSLQIVPDPVP